MNNAYPNLPEIPYKKTTISMNDVSAYIADSPYIPEVKRACYVIFRNEGANGNSGVNNNYIGLQTDGNKSDDFVSAKIVATSVENENMTGKSRRFACFNSFKDSIDIIEHDVVNRGMFIGGHAHPYSNMDVKNPQDLAIAYWKEWVEGDSKSVPDAEFIKDFVSMYNQSISKFK